jgi:hypothetical protein
MANRIAMFRQWPLGERLVINQPPVVEGFQHLAGQAND